MKRLPVSLIEMFVFHPPEGLEGWHYYRVEVGGHAMACITEGGIWLPPWADPTDIEEYIMRTQRREGATNRPEATCVWTQYEDRGYRPGCGKGADPDDGQPEGPPFYVWELVYCPYCGRKIDMDCNGMGDKIDTSCHKVSSSVSDRDTTSGVNLCQTPEVPPEVDKANVVGVDDTLTEEE